MRRSRLKSAFRIEESLPRLSPALRTAQPRQPCYRRCLLLLVDVGVDIHRQADVAVAGQRLGRLGGDVGLAEIGDEGVAETVEIGEAALGILVLEEVACFALLAGLGVGGFLNPGIAGKKS